MPASVIAAIPALPALLLGFWLMQTGNTFQGTILSIRGEIEGFTLAQIGAVGAGFWAGVIIGSLRAAGVIRRVGHIRTFAAFGAIAATAPLVHLLVVDPFVWIAARALTGFCFAGMFIVVESWLNAGASSENRGQILSIYGMTGLLAGICGQLLLPTTDPAGFRAFCIIACIISVALVPIALTQGAAPAPPGEGSHIGLSRLYRDSPLGVAAGFLGGVTTGAFFTLAPIFAEQRGLNTGQIAIFMACGTLGGFLAAWPLGLLSDRYDRRLVIIGAAAAAAASSDRHDRARAGRRLSVASLPLRRSVRRNDHTDLQLGAGPFERRGRARGDGGCFRRPPAGARRWGRGWAFDRGVCNVGHAARPVLHARCGAGPHRRFRNLAAHLGSESSRRAQERFYDGAPGPSRDRIRRRPFDPRVVLALRRRPRADSAHQFECARVLPNLPPLCFRTPFE